MAFLSSAVSLSSELVLTHREREGGTPPLVQRKPPSRRGRSPAPARMRPASSSALSALDGLPQAQLLQTPCSSSG